MNKEEIAELVQVVWDINIVLYDKHENEDYIVQLEVTTDGSRAAVVWNDYILWSSEDDEREWIEDGPSMRSGNIVTCDLVPAHYEPMEPYLRKKINLIIEQISKIRL